MCMKGASANYTPPSPAPTVQTNMSNQTGEEMAETKRKFKRVFESTILGPTASGQKSILGVSIPYTVGTVATKN